MVRLPTLALVVSLFAIAVLFSDMQVSEGTRATFQPHMTILQRVIYQNSDQNDFIFNSEGYQSDGRIKLPLKRTPLFLRRLKNYIVHKKSTYKTDQSSDISPSGNDSLFLHIPIGVLRYMTKSSNCPTLDVRISRQDYAVSSVGHPKWLSRQPSEPIGFCPSKLLMMNDTARIWPQGLLGVVCVCENSRCVMHGVHQCITVHLPMNVLRVEGWRREMLPVGCVCAAQLAQLSEEVIATQARK